MASSEVKLPESARKTTPSVPLPPPVVTHRIVSDLGQGQPRIDYLASSGRLLALALAAVGVTANATFGASMGNTVWQQTLYGLLWASIDGIALWLPTMALWLWQRRHRMLSGVTWMMCAGVKWPPCAGPRAG
jgi:hypothetical protein